MVVGIVASMTIPAMLKSYNDKVRASSYKKAHSIMKQIYMRTIADNGGTNYNCSYLDPLNGVYVSNGCKAFLNAMKASVAVVKECELGQGNTIGNCIPEGGILFPNGSEMYSNCSAFQVSGQNDSAAFVLNNGIYIFTYGPHYFPLYAIDINGLKGPNQWGEDVFTFMIDNYEMKLGGCSLTNQAKDIMLNN